MPATKRAGPVKRGLRLYVTVFDEEGDFLTAYFPTSAIKVKNGRTTIVYWEQRGKRRQVSYATGDYEFEITSAMFVEYP